MKRLAFLLLAVPLLCGCGDRTGPDNAARAESGNEAAAGTGENGGENEAADAGGRDAAAGAPGNRDAPIRGDGAADRPVDPDEADRCGASRYQWLVGRPRSAIPAEPPGATWRITCTSCPITMDYSPARLNIFYDEETRIVEEVRCG